MHELLDAVEVEVLSDDPGLGECVPPRAPSPWVHDNGEWWAKPKPDKALPDRGEQ